MEEKTNKRDITEIIVHCTATPEGRNVGMHDIRRWHKDRGFREIGYHYVVMLDGTVRKGRDDWEIGAHCAVNGHNFTSIGVCYVGGMDEYGDKPKDTRTPEQKESLLKLLKVLKERYPNAKIYGHRDFANKDCPCFDAKSEYADL